MKRFVTINTNVNMMLNLKEINPLIFNIDDIPMDILHHTRERSDDKVYHIYGIRNKYITVIVYLIKHISNHTIKAQYTSEAYAVIDNITYQLININSRKLESLMASVFSNAIFYIHRDYVKELCAIYDAICEQDVYWCIQHWQTLRKFMPEDINDQIPSCMTERGDVIYLWPDIFFYNYVMLLGKNGLRLSKDKNITDEDIAWLLMTLYQTDPHFSSIIEVRCLKEDEDKYIHHVADGHNLMITIYNRRLIIYKWIRDQWCVISYLFKKLHSILEPLVTNAVKWYISTLLLEGKEDLVKDWQTALSQEYNNVSNVRYDSNFYYQESFDIIR